VDERAVFIDGDRVVDVADASDGRLGPDPMAVLEHWEQFTDWARGVELDSAAHVAEAVLRRAGPPVPRPRQVFALALNYRPHAAEVGFEAPEHPLVFTKFPSCLVGPCATVALPSEFVDWETELVVVIGRGGHRIAPDRAWAHVAGLTVGQDLTERRVQVAGKPAQFSLSKSFPGFGPTGPVLVTPDEFPDPDDLGITCLLGEDVVQQAGAGPRRPDLGDLPGAARRPHLHRHAGRRGRHDEPGTLPAPRRRAHQPHRRHRRDPHHVHRGPGI
jgi:2-keto-4-pentenoate hydratase/2-oxohepta-3-ene-1,7-dioic acid hydratase in catechol pathway